MKDQLVLKIFDLYNLIYNEILDITDLFLTYTDIVLPIDYQFSENSFYVYFYLMRDDKLLYIPFTEYAPDFNGLVIDILSLKNALRKILLYADQLQTKSKKIMLPDIVKLMKLNV